MHHYLMKKNVPESLKGDSGIELRPPTPHKVRLAFLGLCTKRREKRKISEVSNHKSLLSQLYGLNAHHQCVG